MARSALRDALVNAFPAPLQFNMFFSDRLNRNFFKIAPTFGTYEEQVFAVLLTANAQAWIAEIVAAAIEAVPDNPLLRQFAQEHGLASISEAALADAHQRTVQAGNTFLNLAVWRSRLGEIEGRIARVEVPLKQGGTAFGTAFLLGPSVVITNYHVLE